MPTLERYAKKSLADLYHNEPGPQHPADTYFHFSFAAHHDPLNTHFGALRVLNDDTVVPRAGFGMHPHRNMEILTYMVSGRLEHADLLGHQETLGPGAVQYMSAGTGIVHSERNPHAEPARLLQIWIIPDRVDVEPRYGSEAYQPEDARNRWLKIASGTRSLDKAPVELYQDVELSVTRLDAGRSLDYALEAGRLGYLVAVEGGLDVNGVALAERESLKIGGGQDLRLTAGAAGAHALLIDLAEDF